MVESERADDPMRWQRKGVICQKAGAVEDDQRNDSNRAGAQNKQHATSARCRLPVRPTPLVVFKRAAAAPQVGSHMMRLRDCYLLYINKSRP